MESRLATIASHLGRNRNIVDIGRQAFGVSQSRDGRLHSYLPMVATREYPLGTHPPASHHKVMGDAVGHSAPLALATAHPIGDADTDFSVPPANPLRLVV